MAAARKPKPIRFEPRWRTADAALRAEIGRLTMRLEEQERVLDARQRRRRAAALSTFHLTIESIACNLLAVSIAAPDRPLAIALANAASQIAPMFGKPARKVVDLMIGLGLLRKKRGYPFRGPTVIQATDKFRRYLPFGNINWSALHLQDDVQVVILNRRGIDGADDADDVATTRARENPKTRRWLQAVNTEMRAINSAIHAAPIEWVGSRQAYVDERPSKPTARLVTLHHRALRRTFNGTYEQGGRLFGGFWQNMKRPDRFRHIRIDGKPIVLVDYGQLFLRLAYAEASIEPPPGDLYDVTGNDNFRADWKRLRDARKKLVNALFFRTAPLKQWPGATQDERAAMRCAFPPGTKPRDAICAIKAKHASIADWFEHGHGLRFMRQESDLIAAVTMALFNRGIVALPIHDAVLVPSHDAKTAKAVMQDEARRLTGADMPADIQTSSDQKISI